MESPLSNRIQYSNLCLSHSSRKHDREKGKEVEKKEVKTFSFANGMIIYTKDTKKIFQKISTADKHIHQSSRMQN